MASVHLSFSLSFFGISFGFFGMSLSRLTGSLPLEQPKTNRDKRQTISVSRGIIMAVSKKKKADSPEDESAFADLHPREGLLGVLLISRRGVLDRIFDGVFDRVLDRIFDGILGRIFNVLLGGVGHGSSVLLRGRRLVRTADHADAHA